MKLSRQQKQVYDFLKERGTATIREIRNGTVPPVMKPDMRISEMNLAYRKEKGTDLIMNAGRNKSREVLKTIARPMTKRVSHVEIVDGVAYETMRVVEV